jgi:hypothetical protein
MKDCNVRLEDRANRVKGFGTANTVDFVAGGKAQTHFTNINTLLGQLDLAKAGQNPAHVGKAALYDSLGIDLVNISRTARQIEKTENGFASPYRLPDNTSHPSVLAHTLAVLATVEDQPADSTADKADKAATRAKFVAYELPADFTAHLRVDYDAIIEANQHNDGEDLDGVENTALIDQIIGQINDEIGHLDAIMHNKYSRQPEKLRAWMSASHVERAPQREKKDSVPPKPA